VQSTVYVGHPDLRTLTFPLHGRRSIDHGSIRE
jgi:hypothetical protein